ncbi:MAG: hypothetical protein ACRDF8_02105 [Chloroflexota bacterium]
MTTGPGWVNREETIACSYCGRDGILPTEAERTHLGAFTVPAADDDASWDLIVERHGPGCEWAATRAHQRGP